MDTVVKSEIRDSPKTLMGSYEWELENELGHEEAFCEFITMIDKYGYVSVTKRVG